MVAPVYIDPTAPAGGDGSLARPFNTWNGIQFQPGTQYLQRAGTTYNGDIVVSARANADAPILISSYGGGSPPVIHGCVDLDGAAYITVAGLSVSAGQSAAIALQSGAENNTIGWNYLENSQAGVWIGNGAGSGNLVTGNVISNNSVFGVAAEEVGSSAEPQNAIVGNYIFDNGSDGIQLDANNFLVSQNKMFSNGTLVPGSSGIHVYSKGADDPFGANNTITGNVVIGTRDPALMDGNGIELDQWTRFNTVSDNFAFANDGGGVVVYDSYGNSISDNFLLVNTLNSDGAHPVRGELILNSALGLTRGNSITGNTALSGSVDSPAFYFDPSSAAADNASSGNVLENLAGGMIYDWGNYVGSDLAFWHGLAPTDTFSGVKFVSAAGYSGEYDLQLGGLNLALDGKPVELAGWSATNGLIVSG